MLFCVAGFSIPAFPPTLRYSGIPAFHVLIQATFVGALLYFFTSSLFLYFLSSLLACGPVFFLFPSFHLSGKERIIVQGHPTDRFGKFSVRKASNPL